jgi:hypothetical protein
MRTLLLSLLVVAILACSKSETTVVNDSPAPVVKIIAPVVSEYYKTGDPLCFKGNVLASKQLEVVRLKLFNHPDATIPCLQFEYSPADKYFDIEKKIIIPSSLSGNCHILFEAVDVSGNTGKVVFGFSSN